MAVPNQDFNEDGSLQTHLDTSMCSEYLIVSADKLSVKHRGPSDHIGHVGAIQANRPALCGELLYYFEMTIKDCGSTGAIALGFTDENFENSRVPGWDPNTYGYHGDNGEFYDNSGVGKPYASKYTTGDIVGAGINFASEEIFFTKNGKLLPSVPMTGKTLLYATIGLLSCNGEVKVNFGQRKFVFDLKAMKLNEDGSLQTHLDTSMCSEYLTVSADKLSVKHKGPSDHIGHVGAIQANCPASGGLLYYFEMTIMDCGSTGGIALGFTDENFENSRVPGWDPNTYGYHGDNGKVHENSGVGKPYASKYTTGDTVGAGINFASEEIFFTKNGKLLPSVPMNGKTLLYATIGLLSYNGEVKVNFGQHQFVFDLAAMIVVELFRQIKW